MWWTMTRAWCAMWRSLACIRLPTFACHSYTRFFALFGLSRTELRSFARSEASRYHTYRYDARQLAAHLEHTQSGGCTPDTLRSVQGFLDRCQLMYQATRPPASTMRARMMPSKAQWDVGQFVAQCEVFDFDDSSISENSAATYYQASAVDVSGSGRNLMPMTPRTPRTAPDGGRGGRWSRRMASPARSWTGSALKAQRSFTEADFALAQQRGWMVHPDAAASSKSGPSHQRSTSSAAQYQAEALARIIADTTTSPTADDPHVASWQQRARASLQCFFDNGYCIPYHSLVLVVSAHVYFVTGLLLLTCANRS